MKKRRLLLFGGFITFVLIVTVIKICILNLSYKGDDQINLIPDGEKIASLEELIQNVEFKNYVLFIDIWGTACGPCLQEFKFVPELKKNFNNKPVKFIYLAAPYGHTYDELRWKNMIKKLNLSGYHLLMNMNFYYKVWEHKGINDPFLIPHYILVDKSGNINEINALRPSNKKELYDQIERLL